ncbi:MAG: AmmeMemoRadiSam system protein B [Planctomycetota bacterium]|nr:AmmeMemoRadiSam system protein B [Planctomycetota bacterium]
MNVRMPAAIGFYDGRASTCLRDARALLEAVRVPGDLPPGRCGGIVPHAGWAYSGALAALAMKALHEEAPLTCVVLFTADHSGRARVGEVYDSGCWRTPLGDVAIDEPLARAILAMDPAGALFAANPAAHAREHSGEVLVPLLQVLSPGVTIVPIMVPPAPLAVAIGQAVGALLAREFPDTRVLGSTDLTHHAGGRFPAPGGRGQAGAKWSAANDKRMLDVIAAMDASGAIEEARRHANACGAGAIAAAIAACGELGAAAGRCVAYTNSYEITHREDPAEPDDTTVGYASVVFTKG